jgi:flagellar protein FlaI
MDAEFQKAVQRNPHLGEYVKKFMRETGEDEPTFMVSLGKDIDRAKVNIILPVGDPVFIHLYGGDEQGEINYYGVEPELNDLEKKKYKATLDIILEKSANEPVPNTEAELKDLITKLFNESIDIGSGGNMADDERGGRFDILQKLMPVQKKVPMTQGEYNKILYHLERDIIGSGPIEPIIRDPYLEDISSIGVDNIFIVHKIFDTIKTDLTFGDDEGLDNWLRSMSERIGRPVSDARPIADGALPDGSRINIIYSIDVSKRGSSFTMRKFSEVPVSIIQLIGWGALSAEMAAYMWMCLENGMSIFFSGETASGKTTMLNACLAFVNPKAKIFSAEDTAEVQPPQPVWQQLITREEGPPESRVDTFALLKAALRSRPNYIIVGEIRGAEGNVAFQGMQCIREGYIAMPGHGPMHIIDLYDQYAADAQEQDGKDIIDISDHKLPVYVSGIDGKVSRSTITNVLRMGKQQLIKVYFDTGEVLEVTPNHRFLLTNDKEVVAEELLDTQQLPNVILPPPIAWYQNDSHGFDFLEGWNILKDELYAQNIDAYKKTAAYKKDRKKFADYFASRNKTIPFDVYRRIVGNTGLPDEVYAIRKGSSEKISVPLQLNHEILVSIARYLMGLDVPVVYQQFFRHVMDITPQHIGKPFWKLGLDQLRVVFEEFLELSSIEKQSLSDEIWYSIGRLAGDDSLYVTRKKTKFSDFRWQVKNKNTDEGVNYAKRAIHVIPHDANSVQTVHKDNAYTTRICRVDRSFVDWLIKKGFIHVNEECVYSKAVLKRIPIDNISNPYAYVAGLLDSDCTIRYTKNRSFEIKLALNVNRDDEGLLFDQLRLVHHYEHQLFPRINCVEFRYHSDFDEHVRRYSQFCHELGINVRTTRYDKIRGIGARVEFSSDRKQEVFSTWARNVAPYMYRQDKKQTIESMVDIAPGDRRSDITEFDGYSASIHKNCLPHLALLARIFGHTLVSEGHECFEQRLFAFKKLEFSRILHIEHGCIDHTYDISMANGSYYIGGKQMMGYVYDTGHPVLATFHASAVSKMIQRLTADPINVPVTFIDNLNIAMILSAVYRKGKFLRRALAIEEIEGYYEEIGGVATRAVFQWEPDTDNHKFRGLNNSYILEDKIATKLGYEDKRAIYQDLFLRAKILEEMKSRGIEDYFDVLEIIVNFYKHGIDGLPFSV